MASDVAQYLRPGEFQNLARRSRNLIKTVGWLLGGYVTSEIKGVSLFQIISSSHLHEKEEKKWTSESSVVEGYHSTRIFILTSLEIFHDLIYTPWNKFNLGFCCQCLFRKGVNDVRVMASVLLNRKHVRSLALIS